MDPNKKLNGFVTSIYDKQQTNETDGKHTSKSTSQVIQSSSKVKFINSYNPSISSQGPTISDALRNNNLNEKDYIATN